MSEAMETKSRGAIGRRIAEAFAGAGAGFLVWSIVGPGVALESPGLNEAGEVVAFTHIFAAKGNYRLTFTVKNDRDRIVSRSLIVRVQASTAPRVVRADADGSDDIDISDAVSVLGYLFLGTATPACLDAADADDAGEIELTDAVYILGFLVLGGPAPPPPYPDCGVDGALALDKLGCVAASPGCR